MFVKAIDEINRCTRPIHTIMRNYGSNKVWPGASTLFFVNNEGIALTCRHVAEHLLHAEKINQQYLLFTQARFRLKKDEHYDSHLSELELQYNYNHETMIQAKHSFVGCFDKITGFDCHMHPFADLAIIRFKGFSQIYYQSFAKFIADDTLTRPGRMLCRLGFPFPEFNNFSYNYQKDDIEWTREGNPRSPSFPIEGIITRLIAQQGIIAGIEMSSPGLRGQSGGPLFDADGLVYGMQSSTRHLHLGFDLENHEIPSGAGTKKVTNMPFLHVGQCVHVSIIKSFLKEFNVTYSEA
ncbi:MAG: trypsin-like peptidase domain-containing protein [Bacteroidetes bacterium]|nr:trypsin-like peptidase domain-containing protein [Bacteroidota bacterium]